MRTAFYLALAALVLALPVHAAEPCVWFAGKDTTDRYNRQHRVNRSISTTTATLSDGAIVSTRKSIWKGRPQACLNCTRISAFHQVFQYSCGGENSLGTPVIQDQTTYDPEAQDVFSSTSGSTLWRALSGKVNDAITLELTTFVFRGDPIGSSPTEFIAEASPSGEVFFATTDRRTVVHEPKFGGIPKVEIPPNVVKLLAALWL